MKFKIIIIICLLAVTFMGCTETTENEIEVLEDLSMEEKLEDFEYLYKVIKENYPFLGVNKRMNGVDWVANYQRYKQKVLATNTDFEFHNVLEEILRDLNNGHTHILDQSFVIFCRDIYYHVLNDEHYKNSWYKIIFDSLNDGVALKRYGLETLSLKEFNNENTEEVISEPIENAEVGDIIEGMVGYIYIPKMIQNHQREKDEKLISNYLKEVKDYQALVIDIRGNSGGNNQYWSDFMLPLIIDKEYSFETYTFYREGEISSKLVDNWVGHEEIHLQKVEDLDKNKFSMLPPEVYDSFNNYYCYVYNVKPNEESIRFHGNIYLLIDRWVYSASEAFAVFAKGVDFATLIGERTGGDGIGHDPWIEMLPNSGYLVRFPVDLSTTSDGTVNEEHKTTPHYEVEFSKKHESFKYDQCIQKVLELEGIESVIN
ncbi:S41 family peptidase [Alkaliphilus peptidifermentans]|uniref:Tricorn protease C1 domain-containing protein n=1 Tax=Alkaliphilus peptidifermentans DSM 18978 TaxID=1120976 RepID=A0A1G5BCI6_9FIRM|nr:S41 family peptidase [Alkaliphilus peptidifermentans]SCX87875.1 Tricorn protease C1 domain-containing protein [Alkaliphilus peptidifermentans DSM 18978]